MPPRSSIKAVVLSTQAKPLLGLLKKHIEPQNYRGVPLNRKHHIAIQANPWLMTPPSRALAALQHHNLLLAAQQQSLQHNLLKKILEYTELNDRVRGIAAYEEYEAFLRELMNSHYAISHDALQYIAEEMCQSIAKIFQDDIQHKIYYMELQRRLLVSSWQTARELLIDEKRMSPRFLLTKRIQHCWIAYKLVKGLPT